MRTAASFCEKLLRHFGSIKSKSYLYVRRHSIYACISWFEDYRRLVASAKLASTEATIDRSLPQLGTNKEVAS